MKLRNRAAKFDVKVDKIFHLSDDSTVIVGVLVGTDRLLDVPCRSEVLVDGVSRGEIEIISEWMPGPTAGRHQRALVTRNHFPADGEEIEAGKVKVVRI